MPSVSRSCMTITGWALSLFARRVRAAARRVAAFPTAVPITLSTRLAEWTRRHRPSARARACVAAMRLLPARRVPYRRPSSPLPTARARSSLEASWPRPTGCSSGTPSRRRQSSATSVRSQAARSLLTSPTMPHASRSSVRCPSAALADALRCVLHHVGLHLRLVVRAAARASADLEYVASRATRLMRAQRRRARSASISSS